MIFNNIDDQKRLFSDTSKEESFAVESFAASLSKSRAEMKAALTEHNAAMEREIIPLLDGADSIRKKLSGISLINDIKSLPSSFNLREIADIAEQIERISRVDISNIETIVKVIKNSKS